MASNRARMPQGRPPAGAWLSRWPLGAVNVGAGGTADPGVRAKPAGKQRKIVDPVLHLLQLDRTAPGPSVAPDRLSAAHLMVPELRPSSVVRCHRLNPSHL